MSIDMTGLARIRDAMISPEQYVAEWRQKNDESMKGLQPAERKYRFYARYNTEREAVVEANYHMQPETKKAVLALPGGLTWMFISEDWCVDSAYSFPIISQMAALRDDIAFGIIRRDEHLDIMDGFLTNGKRNIPVFACFDQDGNQLFRWGPMPGKLAELRQQLRAEGTEARAISAASVAWYADSGWLEVEKELLQILRAVTNPEYRAVS